MVANAELCAALAKAQADVENATKGSVNPHLKNRYADLGAVLEAAKPVLAANGLSVVTLPSVSETAGDAAFTSTLYHSSGQSIQFAFTVPYGAKRDPQGLGGTMTYARRYCLSAWLNMWAEDDDGETAVGRPPAKQAASAAARKPTAKELIELLANAQTQTVLNHLKGEAAAYRGTPEWDSIVAVGKSAEERLVREAKDAAVSAKK